MGIKEPQVTRAHLISFRRSGPGRHVRTLNGMRENTSGSAGQRSARTLRKANRMSAAVEKRSSLTRGACLDKKPGKARVEVKANRSRVSHRYAGHGPRIRERVVAVAEEPIEQYADGEQVGGDVPAIQ